MWNTLAMAEMLGVSPVAFSVTGAGHSQGVTAALNSLLANISPNSSSLSAGEDPVHQHTGHRLAAILITGPITLPFLCSQGIAQQSSVGLRHFQQAQGSMMSVLFAGSGAAATASLNVELTEGRNCVCST
jgi:hypothetical protein